MTPVNVYLDPGDQIRCESVSVPDAGRSWDALWLADMRIFALLDQLEQIRGAIDQYLHERRPPMVIVGSSPAIDPFVAKWDEEVNREMSESMRPYPDRSLAVDTDDLLASIASEFEVPREEI